MANLQQDPVASKIIGAAIEVHRCLGPGLMESVYQTCLAHELRGRGLRVEKEVPVSVMFKGIRMENGFRVDFLVEGGIVVEVKCVDRLMPIHDAQVLTYLRLTGARQAFLFNFNSVTLKEGMKSFLGDGETRSR
jgi:GxxExxY protein